MTGWLRRYRWVLVGVGVLLLVLVYVNIDPREAYMPKCFFKLLTGYDCPGCGSQRAIYAALHGHFAEAISYNPALFVAVPLIFLLLVSNANADRWPRLFGVLNSQPFILAVAAAIILWWILRNVF